MTAQSRLKAYRAELTRFVDATFRYADAGTHAVLRTFAGGSNEVLASVRVPLNGTRLEALIDHAARQATEAANGARTAVFAPRIATFVGARARERDRGNRLVLSIKPDQALALADRSKLDRLQEPHGDGDYAYWAIARAPAESSKRVASRCPADQPAGPTRP